MSGFFINFIQLSSKGYKRWSVEMLPDKKYAWVDNEGNFLFLFFPYLSFFCFSSPHCCFLKKWKQRNENQNKFLSFLLLFSSYNWFLEGNLTASVCIKYLKAIIEDLAGINELVIKKGNFPFKKSREEEKGRRKGKEKEIKDKKRQQKKEREKKGRREEK